MNFKKITNSCEELNDGDLVISVSQYGVIPGVITISGINGKVKRWFCSDHDLGGSDDAPRMHGKKHSFSFWHLKSSNRLGDLYLVEDPTKELSTLMKEYRDAVYTQGEVEMTMFDDGSGEINYKKHLMDDSGENIFWFKNISEAITRLKELIDSLDDIVITRKDIAELLGVDESRIKIPGFDPAGSNSRI